MGHIALDFLDAVFSREHRGILITGQISGKSGDDGRGIDRSEYFIWPDQADAIATWHDENHNDDLYFSPMLYRVRQRSKEQVGITPVIWCDADTAHPDTYKLSPSFYCETSPGRYHCYWVIDGEVTPQWAEQMSKMVTYSNLEEGSDKGGWALAKYLRLPGAKNTKPEHQTAGKPRWEVRVSYPGNIYTPADLIDTFGEPTLHIPTGTDDIPADLPHRSVVMDKLTANTKLLNMLERTPMAESWSEPLWLLECSLFRLGLTAPEVFVLVNGCACDKYARMGRPASDLWKEVCKADRLIAEKGEIVFEMTIEEDDADSLPPPPGIELISDEERLTLPRTFIDEYCEWARQKTNADIHYHEFSAMALMSIVLSEFGHTEMDYGITKLNLWFMVLGVTTRTYKTTSKNLMLQMLRSIQNDKYNYDLGSDATSEGLLLALADRPKRSTLFHRDEAQGMLYATKGGKNYMVGFAETLTELYDGYMPGRLRATGVREIPPTETQFCLYLAGVPEKLGQVLSENDFESGFLARFLFSIGEPEPYTTASLRLTRRERGTAPGVNAQQGQQLVDLRQRLLDARKYWSERTTPGETVEIWINDAALDRLNQASVDLSSTARASDSPKLMEPSANRMHKSIMKLSCLIAMMRCSDVVELPDMLAAIQYCEYWYNTLNHMTLLVQQSEFSATITNLVDYVRRNSAVTGTISYTVVRRKFSNIDNRAFYQLIEAAQEMRYIEITPGAVSTRHIKAL